MSEFKIHRTLNMKKEELEQFILKYGEILMKFCKITTNDSELAWELYQDTMLRLVEHYKKLDISENVKAWAISTAINLWKNKKRKYAWRKRIAKQESYEVHMENEFQIFDYANFSGEQDNSPEDTAIKNELIMFVQSQVRELPEKYRIVVYLYYTADMKIKDIAALCEIPESTVKSRLIKAKKILKHKIESAWK